MWRGGATKELPLSARVAFASSIVWMAARRVQGETLSLLAPVVGTCATHTGSCGEISEVGGLVEVDCRHCSALRRARTRPQAAFALLKLEAVGGASKPSPGGTLSLTGFGSGIMPTQHMTARAPMKLD